MILCSSTIKKGNMFVHESEIIYRSTEVQAPEVLGTPEKCVNYMKGAFIDPTVEYFYVIILNRKNRPIARHMVTKGTATGSLVHPREVLKPVLLASGCAAICVHNHPSGDPAPSRSDVQITRQLREAFKTMQIDLLDHIVIGERDCDPQNKGFYSFAEAGLL